VLEGRGDLFEKQHRSFGPEHRIGPRHLPDLGHRLFDALHRGLGFPTESVAAEAGSELPLTWFGLGHYLQTALGDFTSTAQCFRLRQICFGGTPVFSEASFTAETMIGKGASSSNVAICGSKFGG